VGIEDLFDFSRINILSTRADHIFAAIHDVIKPSVASLVVCLTANS
jgi:hypothetical protein